MVFEFCVEDLRPLGRAGTFSLSLFEHSELEVCGVPMLALVPLVNPHGALAECENYLKFVLPIVNF